MCRHQSSLLLCAYKDRDAGLKKQAAWKYFFDSRSSSQISGHKGELLRVTLKLKRASPVTERHFNSVCPALPAFLAEFKCVGEMPESITETPFSREGI